MSQSKKIKQSNVLDLVSKEDLVEKLENLSTELESQDQQIFEMRSLLQSGKGLGNILKLDQLFNTLLAIIREKYHLVNSSVLLIDSEQDLEQVYFRMYVHHGIPEEFNAQGVQESIDRFKFPATEGLLWQIIKNGETFSVQDRKRRPRFTQAWQDWNLSALYSDVWCPLIVKGEVIGIITLGPKKNGKQIRENEFSFINDLLAIAVTNIDSVMKYEKNQAILKNVQILYDANQKLSEIQDAEALCKESLKTTVEGLNAEAGVILLYKQETKSFALKASWNQNNESRYNINDAYINKAHSKNRTIRIRDKENIEQNSDNTIHSLIITPLFRGNEAVGVIKLFNKINNNEPHEIDPNGYFSSDDESLATGLGDQLVTNLQKLKLYHESITDSLTELYNTGHYQKEIERLVNEATHNQSPLSLAVLDIDHFKTFNDDYGHKAGDAVLKEVGSILKTFSQDNFGNLAFRYGGEEFCLIMPSTTTTQAYQFIEGLRQKIEKHKFQFHDQKFKVTISGGIASLSDSIKTASQIFLAADKELYKSKEAGRNKISVAKGPMKKEPTKKETEK